MDLETTPIESLSTKQLQFLNRHKLSDEQIRIALAVDHEARRQGINPEFVWPMIYQESKFDPNARSEAGAFGVMQLMPDTAKGLRVDRDDLKQNIYGGISLLKELISNPKIGNDPHKVLAGYNASTETRNKFYESGDYNDLKTETLLHMEKVARHYDADPNAALPQVNYEPPKEDAVPPSPPMPSASEAGGPGTVEPLTNNVPLPVQQLVAGALPVVTAAKFVAPYAAKYGAGEKILETALEHTGLGKTSAQSTAPTTGQAPAQAGQPQYPSSPWSPPKDVQSEASGRARQTSYNETSAITAAKQRAQYDALIKAGYKPDQALAMLSQTLGSVGATESGVLAPGQVVSDIDAAAARKATNASQLAKSVGSQWKSIEEAKLVAQMGNPEQKAEALSWLGKVMQKVKGATEHVPSHVARAAQGLFTAGATVPLAWNEYKNEKNPAGAAAIAATGAGLSLAPIFSPRLARPAGYAGAGLSGLYTLAHPQEAAAAMRVSDVIDPTVAMFMTGQEVHEPAIPELQNENMQAGAGRGFVNPPLARP